MVAPIEEGEPSPCMSRTSVTLEGEPSPSLSRTPMTTRGNDGGGGAPITSDLLSCRRRVTFAAFDEGLIGGVRP
jgi:hypothetical protein